MVEQSTSTPETADMDIKAVHAGLLSQIQQAGQRNELVELARYCMFTGVNERDPRMWFSENLENLGERELQTQLLGMQKFFEKLRENRKECMKWFASRIEGAEKNNKELHTAVYVRLDHFMEEWLEKLGDMDLAVLLRELDESMGLPIQERLKIAEKCQSALGAIFDSRDMYVERESLSWRSDAVPERTKITSTNFHNLDHGDAIVEKRQRRGRVMWRNSFRAHSVLRGIKSIQREGDIRSHVGHADHAEMARDTEKYGAKGANLLAAKKALGGLNKSLDLTRITIPAFTLLNVDTYERWKKGEDITQDLQQVYQWMGGKKVWVRSSARYSEDGETTTGAGIYDSVLLKKAATLAEFTAAVEQVYSSVDSPEAVEYRALNTVTESEQMGIVVQECVSNMLERRSKGYINTVRPNVPGLLEIVLEEGDVRCICNRQSIDEQIYNGERHDIQDITHHQLDYSRIMHLGNDLADLAHVGKLLEMHFGYPVQIEFINSSFNVNLLQARRLPPQFLKAVPVEFPEDQEPFLESNAVGAGDMELDVLPTRSGNTDKTGVVIFYRCYSMSTMGIESYLPGKGAVIILSPSEEGRGHIETLCVERGLMCVFPSQMCPETDKEMSPELLQMFQMARNEFGEVTHYDSFAGHKKVRIISDGMEAKVYAAREIPKE